MIDYKTSLDKQNVIKIVGNDHNKQSIYERFVYSMVLLDQLDSLLNGYHYTFKGGTSLLLIFKNNSRFSIDIDISMNEKEFDNRNTLLDIFKRKIEAPFIDVVLEEWRSHSNRNIKAAHYRFGYKAQYSTKEQYVLLDIVFQDNSINTSSIDVSHPLLASVGKNNKVNTINIDDLLGDKLTAVGPNTIGIRYDSKNQFGRPKGVEIVKQLFDCAFLINNYSSFDRVVEIYKEICLFQIKYCGDSGLTIPLCIADAISLCELILSNGKSRKKDDYNILIHGLEGFNFYKFGNVITFYDLQKCAFDILLFLLDFYKEVTPQTKKENPLDYYVRTSIDKRELLLLVGKKKVEELESKLLVVKYK